LISVLWHAAVRFEGVKDCGDNLGLVVKRHGLF